MDKTSMRMKLEGKSLENEAKRLLKEAQKEKMKAKQAQKKGQIASARLFATNAVRYEKQAQQLLQSSATTNGYAVDVRNGAVAAQMFQNMNKATSGIEAHMKKIDVQKVSATRTKMNGLKESISTANTLLNGEDDLELVDGAEGLLEQLEMENMADVDLNLEAIPSGVPGSGYQQSGMNKRQNE